MMIVATSRKLLLILALCLFASVSYGYQDDDLPLTTDSRIKTYVYNENEIYLMVIHFGYQSHIEFAKGEEIETISLGDTYSWKITPLGRRLFIKPMEENIRTNMTVITNKRTYQFDIVSKNPDESTDHELAYVLKFYYPNKNQDKLY